MRYPFLDLGQANAPYLDELQAAASAVIASGWYLRGEQTRLLEQEMAQLCCVKHCVAVSNGLDALRLIIRAYKELGRLHEGDHVIVPANTYVASVLAISDNGLVPVLVEPSEATLNLDTQLAEQLLTPQVRAIMTVHLYGTPCWDATLKRLATERGILVIEDNAQAIDARAAEPGLNGSHVTGGLGHAAAHSFYPTKNVGALGDAGAVTTDDEALADAVRAIANYGSDRRYHNIYCGLNCRIDELQAAMLRVKLRHIAQESARRREIASTYDSFITHPAIVKPLIDSTMQQVWHQYVIRVQGDRDHFRDYLTAQGVGSDIHYATPPHQQPCYSQLAHSELPITEMLASQVVSLPIAHPITVADARAIAQIINDYQP